MKKITVFVFGSELIDFDKTAIEVSRNLKDELKDIEFIVSYNPDDILHHTGDKIFILDVVKGIDEVKIIEDISLLKKKNTLTSHDLDLGFILKLIESMKY